MKHLKITRPMKALAFVAIALLSSCTLYMDDIDLPEDQRGFEDPVVQVSDLGTYEYQFNENVKSITDNVLEYISHVEADSIIYYFESVPESMLPKTGEFVSAQVSSRMPRGINNRVLSVQNVGGLYKVTTTKAEIGDIFKKWKVDYAFDLNLPEINSIDSATMAEAGITEEELVYDYWKYYNDVRPNDSISTRSTRSVDLVNEHLIQDVTLNVLNIEASSDGNPVIKNLKIIKKLESFFGGDVKFILKGTYVIPLSLSLKAEYGPTIGLCGEFKFGMKPYWNWKAGIGIEKLNISKLYNSDNEEFEFNELEDVSLVKSGLDFLTNNRKDAKTSIKPTLPKLNFALGSTGLFIIIEPRFGFNVNAAVMGTVEKTFYCDETEITVALNDWSIDKEKSKTTSRPSPYSSPATFGLAGTFGASISGGVGLGLSVLGIADAQFTFDFEGGFNAEANLFETSDFSGGIPIVNMDSYTPSKNYLELYTDLVTGFQLKAGKKKWSWEIARINLLRNRLYLFPSLDDFVFEHKYNPVTGLICGGTAHLTVGQVGIFPHRIISDIGVAVIDRSPEGSSQPIPFITDTGGALLPKKSYSFDITLPEKQEGYEICPMLSPRLGRNAVINGTPIVVPGDVNAFEVKSHKMELNCSHKVGYINNKQLKQYIEKRYNKKFPNLQNSYYYNWSDYIDIVGGPNIQKWGVRVTIGARKDYMSQTIYDEDILIEDCSTQPIKSGKKSIMFDFVDTWIPNTGDDDIAPYHVSVRPYYYDALGIRRQMHAKSIDINLGAEYYSRILNFNGSKPNL